MLNISELESKMESSKIVVSLKNSDFAQIILENYLTGLATIILFSAFVSYFLAFVLVWVFENYMKKANLFTNKLSFRQKFFPLIWFLFLLLGFKIFEPLVIVPEAHLDVINKIWQIIIIVVATSFLINLVELLKNIIVKKYDITIKNNLEQRKIITQLNIAEKILFVVLILIGFSAILLSFEEAKEIGTSLIASAGLAGIIIGFAAQKTIANLIAGFQIAFTQPFRIDDVVIVQGEWGRIEEITLTYIVIRIWDKRRLVVPITYLLENPFQNWTRNDSEILGYVYLYTDYNVPLDDLRKEFNRLCESSEYWTGEVAVVQVTNCTEKTQEIRFLVSACDSGQAWEFRCYLREHLIRFLQQNYPESLPRIRLTKENPEKVSAE